MYYATTKARRVFVTKVGLNSRHIINESEYKIVFGQKRLSSLCRDYRDKL